MPFPRDTPLSIRLFAFTYLSFAICALINNIIVIDGFLAQLSAQAGQPVPSFVGGFAFGLRFVVRLILIWLIVWRVSNVARWIVFVFALPWAYQVPSGIHNIMAGDTDWLVWLVTVLFLIASISCLLMRQARLWFARKGHTIAADRSIFD